VIALTLRGDDRARGAAVVRLVRVPPAATLIAPDAIPLRVTGLTRHYGRLVGLAHFDLELRPGQCVALIGANGSGKSTAVRTISGLLEPTEGTVRVCGHDPHSEPDAEAARAALALVADTPMLYDDLTVRQHLSLVALVHRVTDDGIEERIDRLLERLGLAHRADFLPAELSRGLKQKTGLACALIRPAKLLVLDEPVVGLDPPSQALLVELLLDAKASGTAVLLTTHQMAFADGVADRAIVLGEGEVLDQGPWAAVRKRAAERGWLPADA
jgi:ABC-2 type transport system ATP-binding protein